MATGHGTNYGWFRYVDTGGNNWSMRVDKVWGALAASGFAAYNSADPVWPRRGRYRPRMAVLQETTSGRITRRVCGATTATALTKGTTLTTYARGSAGLETLTSLGPINERTPKSKATINSFPDPTTA